MSIPDGFVWGVATASYQIEGATNIDGRGQSIWDMFCKKPGAVWNGDSGDVACDHYHRYREDIALMKQLGVTGYRFSVAWPRILPEGTCSVNEKGLAFYDKLVDEMLAAGVEPWLTLYHWDLPLELYHRGGWMNPDCPKWFADYTQIVVDRLGDRVGNWFTINEPQCFIGIGMSDGRHAPGDKLRWAEVLLAGHHSLLGHGMAVQAIRARAKRKARVGYAPFGNTSIPASDDPKDVEAARKHMFTVSERHQWQNAWWMDPVFFGRYPEEGLELYGDEAPRFTEGEMKTISEPLDFLGANIYQGVYVSAGHNGAPSVASVPAGWPLTAFRWVVTEECLYWGPRLYHERYKVPVVISENGLSNQDWIHLDGKVHDPQRIDYLHRHLWQMKKAIQDGVPVEAYFQWSLLDNFEWAEGYKERFGLVFVDFPTQARIPKDSFHWYKEVIATNGASISGGA